MPKREVLTTVRSRLARPLLDGILLAVAAVAFGLAAWGHLGVPAFIPIIVGSAAGIGLAFSATYRGSTTPERESATVSVGTGTQDWSVHSGTDVQVGDAGPSPAEPSKERQREEPPHDPHDPPRSAYALLVCPEKVVGGQEFELVAGLSQDATPGVDGKEMRRPPSKPGPYTLTIQIVAEGFSLKASESWRNDLFVTAEAAYPSLSLHLTAMPTQDPVMDRSISATYEVDGQTIGIAERFLAVVRDAGLLATTSISSQYPGIVDAFPSGEEAADLTVCIYKSKTVRGRLLWTFGTPHAGLPVPSTYATKDLDDGGPEKFAQGLINNINAREGKDGMYAMLGGAGKVIADKMPDEFWDLLKAVSARVSERPLTILLLSQEPYVPWELALVDPPIDPHAPPFLGAQAAVGRWVLGHRKPKMPPPREVQVRSSGVVWGVYSQDSGWERLKQAEKEGAKLQVQLKATHVNATTAAVLKCLQGIPKADLLHFALHGVWEKEGIQNGLILVDGQPLDPFQVRFSSLQEPFVFLNACQVGAGDRILGDYGGMAEAFLYAGASGVVAALWNINDVVAKGIALRFYEKALGEESVSPSEILRRERGAFRNSPKTRSATYLAYQFFGHPGYKLRRATESSQPKSTHA